MEDKDKIPGEELEVSLDSRGGGAKEGQRPVEVKFGEEEHFGVEDSVIGTEVVRRKMSFGEWLENFWYHHKWHFFASLFIIAVIAVCVSQCVMNVSAPSDLRIIYAGGKTGFDQSKDGVVPHAELAEAFSSLTRDYDENGERIAELEFKYWLSDSELNALRDANEDKPKDEKVDVSYHAQVVKSNDSDIRNLLVTPGYYVWLISDDLYENLVANGGEGRFDPLDVLAPDGDLPFYVDEDGTVHKTAVYLSELGVSEISGLEHLPEDTLLVLKHPSALDRDLTDYNNSADFIKILLGVS